MGSIDTMTLNSVAPVCPPEMRLPASTRLSEIRPAMGARTSVHSRLSWACFKAALAEASWPEASRWMDFRVSNSRSVSVALQQWRRAIDVLGRDVELRLRPFDIGFRLLDGDLVRALIDDEQQVVLLDDLPFLEMNGVDESGNPGADFDRLQCGEAAGIFVPLGNALL